MLTFIRLPVLLVYSLLETTGRMLVFLPLRTPLPASRSFAGLLLTLMLVFAVVVEDSFLGAMGAWGTMVAGAFFMGGMAHRRGRLNPLDPESLRVWNIALLGMAAGGGLAAVVTVYWPDKLVNAPLVGCWLGIAIAVATQREQRRQAELKAPKS